jgi:hypothetical protein
MGLMEGAMRAILFLSSTVALALTLICGNAYAVSSEGGTNTLRGLKGVYVGIEDLNKEVVKDGLTADSIRTEVELKLHLAGIPVLSKEAWAKEPGLPYLDVSVNAGKPEQGGYIYNIIVALRQEVILVRSPHISAQAETWFVAGIGITPDLKDIRDVTKEEIDKFINAYLSVNPEK